MTENKVTVTKEKNIPHNDKNIADKNIKKFKN